MKEDYIKIIDLIDINDLLNFYYQHQADFIWKDIDNKGKQSGLQYALNRDPWLSATERTDIPSKYFFLTNNFFKNSPFDEVIKKFNLTRTRLLWLNPYSCYTMHFDDSPRIHIPLITNSDSFVVFKDGIVEHLEIGKVYWVDTRKTHTAINGGELARLHLVGCER